MAKIALLQMASTPNVKQNMSMALEGIKSAAEQGAKLIALPEEFATLGLSSSQKREKAEEFEAGPLQSQLAQAALDNHIWIVGGTLPIQSKLFSKAVNRLEMVECGICNA